MPQATQPASNCIAIAFDFDRTLFPDSYDALIKKLGHEPKIFRNERYYPLLEKGWDGIQARFYTVIDESQRRAENHKVTRAFLQALGHELKPFAGVMDLFDRLREFVHGLDPDIDLEFYLISSGFAEIARGTRIAKHFKAIWGCEFEYNDQDEVVFLKHTVEHAEKPHYLNCIAKGDLSPSGDSLLFVYEDVPLDKLHLPISQVIYLGDGKSDLPCFTRLNQTGGIALGVYEKGTAAEWAQEKQVSQSQRILNLAPADYQEHSELMTSLTLALESLCKQIQLRRLGVHE